MKTYNTSQVIITKLSTSKVIVFFWISVQLVRIITVITFCSLDMDVAQSFQRMHELRFVIKYIYKQRHELVQVRHQ